MVPNTFDSNTDPTGESPVISGSETKTKTLMWIQGKSSSQEAKNL